MANLRCCGLCKSFDGIRAISDMEIRIPDIGITAIIGPNGAGKTTLINILTGFLRPDAGRCLLGERDLSRLPPHRIVKLGIARTFQNLRLILELSALDNALLARPNQRGETLLRSLLPFRLIAEETRNRDVAMEYLKFVGLEGKQEESAGELSYGQQKLLSLACCLATEARILLLDEPVAGVHPEMVCQILDLLRHLHQQGRMIVFIEHNIDAVRQVADHVIVMDEGAIIAEGPPNEVLDRPEIMEAYLG